MRLGRGQHRGDADPCLRRGRLYYRLPLPHHKHMKSTNMLERLMRALAVEMHENWLEATRYLDMDHLKEH